MSLHNVRFVGSYSLHMKWPTLKMNPRQSEGKVFACVFLFHAILFYTTDLALSNSLKELLIWLQLQNRSSGKNRFQNTKSIPSYSWNDCSSTEAVSCSELNCCVRDWPPQVQLWFMMVWVWVRASGRLPWTSILFISRRGSNFNSHRSHMFQPGHIPLWAALGQENLTSKSWQSW